MEPLKLVAQALGIPLDSPVEKMVEAISDLSQEAKDGRVWKDRAEENLSKLEAGQKIEKENAELRADAFLEKAKRSYRITAAEEVPLKKLYLSGPAGEASVKELIAARADQEYLTRVSSLQTIKEPVSALVEIEGRTAELMAKNDKLSKSDAQVQILARDPDLAERYRLEVVSGAKGGDR